MKNYFAWKKIPAAIVITIIIVFFMHHISFGKTIGQTHPFGKTTRSGVLTDDLEYDSLRTAVEQSLRYYRNLPDDAVIRYPDRSFSKSEIITAFERFIEIAGGHDGPVRTRMIKREFDFLISTSRGGVLFTGYYDELIRGSMTRTGQFNTPLYGRPDDLVTVDLLPFIGSGRTISGKLFGNRLVPYDTREKISTEGSFNERAPILCYVNKLDLFYLQIEGSGLIEFSDTTRIRVGYDSDNGYDFSPLFIPSSHTAASKTDIYSYLADHAGETDRILNANPRYVFFRKFDEPTGTIGEELVPGRSVAADPDIYPAGAIAYIRTSGSENRKGIGRFVCIHDTGSAIKGSGRIDLYFGSGETRRTGGAKFRERGKLLLLVPKNTGNRTR
jgi:membrane-bound lytic murein transglycosylase A